MANLADTIVFGDLTVTRDHNVRGTMTVNGVVVFEGNVSIGGVLSGNGSGLTNLNASQLGSGTVPTARLPAAAMIGDTTYSAGSGLSLSGTTFSVSSPFNPNGTYGSLRAQATTQADVGLGNVPNWSQATFDGRYLGISAKAADSNLLDGIDSSGFARTTGTYAIRATATTKADVGLGSVSNVAASTSPTANTVAQRDSSGDIQARLFRSGYTTANGSIGFIMTQVDTGTNNFVRPSTPAQVKASLGITAGDVSGLSDAATTTVAAIRSGTTASNVGLGSVLNVASYSKTQSDGRYATAAQGTLATNAQPKETGKGLSTNDFTGALLSKLNGIAAGAQANVATNLGQSRTTTTYTVTSSTGSNTTLAAATTSLAGVMSSTDKSKLDGVAAGATANATDAQLRARSSHTGTQPVSTITGLSDAATTTVAAIRSGTTKANVGLGSVRDVASYSQAESNSRHLRKDVSDTLTGDLTVTGEVLATDVTITSDRRVKFDLQEVSGALAKVCSLTGYSYQMKGLPKGERRLGLVAQDVLKAFPETVHGSEETQYSLAYGNLVAALVQAIKEQQTTIESLEARLGRLEHQVNS